MSELTVEAELISIGEPAPRPGCIYVISLMLYKVLRILNGIYSDEFLLVGHKVPDLGAPEFQLGVRHRLNLTDEFPQYSSILNSFRDEKPDAGVFYCISFEVIG